MVVARDKAQRTALPEAHMARAAFHGHDSSLISLGFMEGTVHSTLLGLRRDLGFVCFGLGSGFGLR